MHASISIIVSPDDLSSARSAYSTKSHQLQPEIANEGLSLPFPIASLSNEDILRYIQ